MGRSIRRETTSQWSFAALACTVSLTLFASSAAYAEDDLLELSLEDLMNVEVTSVSKKAESKNETAAAVHVITSEDIRRGGFQSVPEALRVVPGVQVSRIDANRWAISIRGFRQEFSNKLLVMIDGRAVYTPLFGGVVWAEQNIAMQDVERIEVIRGPGGAIWGANAVNGVINIITKHTEDTQGGLVSAHGGTQQYGGMARYGAKIGDDTTFRVTARGEKIEDFDFNQNYNGNDEWANVRVGMRSDTKLDESSSLGIHVDYFDLDTTSGIGQRNPAPPFNVLTFSEQNQRSRGGAILVKYDKTFSGDNSMHFKTFFDTVDRRTTLDERSQNFETSLQFNSTLNENVSVVSGIDYRYWTSHNNGVLTTPSPVPAVALSPNDDDLHLGSGFVQLEIDLFDDMLTLIAGTKVSVNSWSGFEYQPSGRFVFKPVEGHTIWGAVSRAVRTPTAIDNDLNAFIGPVNLLGDRDFDSEELLSAELGYRFYQLDWLTLEGSAFYSDYDKVSAIVGPPPVGPFVFTNPGSVKLIGGEVELSVVPLENWKLTAGYSIMKFLREHSPPSPLGTGSLNRTHPRHQFVIRSVVDVTEHVEFDASLYYVDGLGAVTPTLRGNNVGSYFRFDLRVGIQPTDWLEIALVGQNLLDPRHAEYNDVQGNQSTQVPRSGYAQVTVDF